MDRQTLNTYEEKGLPCPFVVTKKGEVEIAQSGAALSKEVSQMATVIFETIGAVGDIKVDQFEMIGAEKRLVISFSNDRLVGTIFPRSEKHEVNTLLTLIRELQGQPVKEAKPAEPVIEKPEEVVKEKPVEEEVPVVEKEVEEEVLEEPVQEPEPEPAKEVAEPVAEEAKVKIGTEVIDSMKSTMQNYLGDFTERILKNQLKAQRINLDELFDDDARRLIFALGKAAGMIIGPSKGREMTNKLLELLK
jgi:hypothetical protein